MIKRAGYQLIIHKTIEFATVLAGPPMALEWVPGFDRVVVFRRVNSSALNQSTWRMQLTSTLRHLRATTTNMASRRVAAKQQGLVSGVREYADA